MNTRPFSLTETPFVSRNLTALLQSKPTFHNTSLLHLLRRFEQYYTYTFVTSPSPPANDVTDSVLGAWRYLVEENEEIITNEEVTFHPVLFQVPIWNISNSLFRLVLILSSLTPPCFSRVF